MSSFYSTQAIYVRHADTISALFYLHEEELKLAIQVGNEEQATRSTAALRSLTRLVIYATKASSIGVPLDLDSIAFWSHKIVYHAAMCHIRYAIRDQDWGDDLQVCRSYLRYFTPRYKLHCWYSLPFENAI